MKIKTRTRNLWHRQHSAILTIVVLLLVVITGCTPESTEPSEQPSPSPTQSEAMPTEPVATATSEEPMATTASEEPVATTFSEVPVPAGWVTYSGEQCEYGISHPPEMQVSEEGLYSRTLAFNLDSPGQGARNFVYVSVIVPDFQSGGDELVYNYDPAESDILLNMQVGESKASRDVADIAQWFTYERKPDTEIGGHVAQAYENVQPWEFPEGTKEIRYYMSLNGCTYLIGGYLDTTGSNQPGAISEELFNQIVATIRLDS